MTIKDVRPNRPVALKVPLSVGWLSENGLLEQAAKLLGYTVYLKKSDTKGVVASSVGSSIMTTSGSRKLLVDFKLMWDDNLLFTTDQLKELGFD